MIFRFEAASTSCVPIGANWAITTSACCAREVVVERYGVRPVLLDEQVDFLEPLDRVGGVPGHDVDAVTGLAQGARALLEHVRGNVGIRDG